MHKSVTALAIAEASKVAQRLLSAEGFTRRGVHLVRRSSDVLHCVHFQASKWATASDGEFTVNFIVTWPDIYDAWTGKPLPANPATASYPIQARIGSCLPERTDVWWSVGSETNVVAVAGEAGAVIAETATAFFARFQTTMAILAELRQSARLPGLTEAQSSLVHAFLAQSLGHTSEAKEVLGNAMSKATSSPFRTTIRSFAQRANIALHT